MKKGALVAILLPITFLALAMVQTASAIGVREEGLGRGLAFFGAALALGIAAWGVGMGMGNAASALAGAVAERPEIFGRTLLYIVFIEAIAIYALVLGFMVLVFY